MCGLTGLLRRHRGKFFWSRNLFSLGDVPFRSCGFVEGRPVFRVSNPPLHTCSPKVFTRATKDVQQVLCARESGVRGKGGNHCREKATKYYKMLQMLQNRAKFDPEIFLGCPFHEMHKKHILGWRSSRYTPLLIGGFKKKTVFMAFFLLLKKTLFFLFEKKQIKRRL